MDLAQFAKKHNLIHLHSRRPFVKTHQWFRTQRNIFEIFLNQPEMRLHLPYSDWFESKRTSVWIQINRKMVNTFWFQVDLIRFLKYLSVCNKHPLILNKLPHLVLRKRLSYLWRYRRCCSGFNISKLETSIQLTAHREMNCYYNQNMVSS